MDIFNQNEGSEFQTVSILAFFPKMLTEHAINSKVVKELIQRDDLHFDLVINEEFFHDAFNMFAYKFKAPLITFSKYLFDCKQKYSLFNKTFIILSKTNI